MGATCSRLGLPVDLLILNLPSIRKIRGVSCFIETGFYNRVLCFVFFVFFLACVPSSFAS